MLHLSVHQLIYRVYTSLPRIESQQLRYIITVLDNCAIYVNGAVSCYVTYERRNLQSNVHITVQSRFT